MNPNRSLAIKVGVAFILVGSLGIGIHSLKGSDRERSRHASTSNEVPKGNERSESKEESTASQTHVAKPRSDRDDAYAWLREEISTQASKQGKSKKDVAVEKINEARRTYGSADGMYSSLCDAFWDEPEVFLEAMKATAQGRESAYAVACYVSQSSNQNSIEHLEKAYQILNPGSARINIAETWVSMVTRLQGLDQSITLIEKFEDKDERHAAVFAVKRAAERNGTVLTSQQLEQLNRLKPSR